MYDHAVIQVRGGRGGNGIISGRREKFVPRGGPDGGDGGIGGSVFLEASSALDTLLAFRYTKRFAAEDGGAGEHGRRHGRNGSDAVILVPVGTVAARDGSGVPMSWDLSSDGQRERVARGGAGGRGNASFTTATNRFPVIAEAGEEAEAATLRLELKLLADVGVVGRPNAGKSSLVAHVSAARPKVAAYPFTTLEPALGVVEWKERRFVIVDIPGIIRGAHAGAGLGLDFLRHVERTRVLVHLVDGEAEDALATYESINREMRLFNEMLGQKKQIVAVSKVDLPAVFSRCGELRRRFATAGVSVRFVSAITGEGVNGLLDEVLLLLPAPAVDRSVREERPGMPVVKPTQPRVRATVAREGSVLVVHSDRARRIAMMIDANDLGARTQFYTQLARLGVVKALEDAGVREGDVIRFGDVEMEWR